MSLVKFDQNSRQVTLTVPSDGRLISFELKYIVFGSKSSIDADILIWIPENLTNVDSHVYLKWCYEFDRKLQPLFNKPLNSSLGHWKDNILTWSQKGSELAETNNSIIKTFNNHEQMFNESPIRKMMSRNAVSKIPGALRTILGKLSKSILGRPELDVFLFKVLENMTQYIEFDELHKFYKEIFAGNTGNSQNNKLRNKISGELVNNLSVYNIGRILDLFNNTDAIFSQILRKVMKIRYVGVSMIFLQNIDFVTLEIPNNLNVDRHKLTERYKTIVFQVIQTSLLIDKIEVYDKDDMLKYFPQLEVFLFRKGVNRKDLQILTNEMRNFINKIRSNMNEMGLNEMSTEID